MGKISKRCSKAIAIGCALIVSASGFAFMPSNATVKVEAADYNYAKGLQYSMYLYDANMCGTEVDNYSAMDWRGNCHTDDANATAPNGKSVDVSGGYHDAGDHVKFGLPQAYSASVLGWGYYEFKDAYTQTGQADHMKTISTYFANYFKNCTVMENGKVTAFCYQVGEGNSDHDEWCSPESQNINRPTYWATSSNPATDIVANTVGALAFHYKNFGDTESLTYAKALYEFAKSNSKQVATDGTTPFYTSDSYIDDLMWAAAALYTVTGDQSYVTDANQFLNDTGDAYKFCSDWPLCWGNMWPVVNLIFGQLSSGINNNQHLDWGSLNSQMMEQVEKTMTSFQSKTTLDGGYVCFDNWGSARYNTAMQLVGLAYDKINGTDKYGTWAKSQMDYLMGGNNKNQCYITGFSDNSVTNAHHRAASGLNTFPKEHTHIDMGHTLIGALVGGPKQDGSFNDNISEYEYTEVTLDYNAGFAGALAGLYLKYGSGQSVDSSIVGVNGSKVPDVTTTTTTSTTTTTTTTSTSNSVTNPTPTVTTTGSQSGGKDILTRTDLEKNTDGTDVLKIYVNTDDNDTVTVTMTGGKPGATTSGQVGYWDNNAQKWVGSVDDWEEKKFDSNGNLTITGVKVPKDTKDVQIMLTYYADWSTGTEKNLDKSSLGVSVTSGTGSTNTTVTTVTSSPYVTSYTSTSTTTGSQSGGKNILTKTELEKNTDGTDVLKIHVDTDDNDTVTVTMTGGKPGATTSGEVGYWDNNSQKWVGKYFDWAEKKFDSNGNLTITGVKVPKNTKDVQIMLTYYADWSTGVEKNLDKSSLNVSVTSGNGGNTTVTSSPNNTTVSNPINTTAPTPRGENIVSKTDFEKNTDGTDVLKIYINTTDNDTVTITMTGGKPGATTSGEVGYWDNNTQKWVGKYFDWAEKKFDGNGNLTITGVKVPKNTKDVQIMLTYYADWSTGVEKNLDKSSLNVSVTNNGATTNPTTVTTKTTTVYNPTPTVTATSTSRNTGSATLVGDVNGDGSVKSNDLLMLKKYLLGLEDLTTSQLANADINGDGDVKSNDLLQLKKMLLGLA